MREVTNIHAETKLISDRFDFLRDIGEADAMNDLYSRCKNAGRT